MNTASAILAVLCIIALIIALLAWIGSPRSDGGKTEIILGEPRSGIERRTPLHGPDDCFWPQRRDINRRQP